MVFLETSSSPLFVLLFRMEDWDSRSSSFFLPSCLSVFASPVCHVYVGLPLGFAFSLLPFSYPSFFLFQRLSWRYSAGRLRHLFLCQLSNLTRETFRIQQLLAVIPSGHLSRLSLEKSCGVLQRSRASPEVMARERTRKPGSPADSACSPSSPFFYTEGVGSGARSRQSEAWVVPLSPLRSAQGECSDRRATDGDEGKTARGATILGPLESLQLLCAAADSVIPRTTGKTREEGTQEESDDHEEMERAMTGEPRRTDEGTVGDNALVKITGDDLLEASAQSW